MDKGFGLLERLITATNIRHRVLSSNIANVDTPGYRAKEIDFRRALEGASAELKATAPGHIQAGPAGGAGSVRAEETHSWGDRNNVELDIEVAKMTENALLYQTGVRLLSTKMRMIRNAVRGR